MDPLSPAFPAMGALIGRSAAKGIKLGLWVFMEEKSAD